MGDVERRRGTARRRREDNEGSAALEAPAGWALGVYLLLLTAAPLAFGAVDRVAQIGVLGLFTLGLLLHPPQVPALSPKLRWVLGGVLLFLVVKEFAPAGLFGRPTWRVAVQESLGLQLPWTHHPEPTRALDALLVLGLAALWFCWVQTLASGRANRPWMAWGLLVAAALVAAVSFATRVPGGEHIYGLRYSAGWQGFGPFPNRNHTACFLAMGSVAGFGCLTWAGLRRHYLLIAVGAGLALVSMAALLSTRSRGGLLAFAVGLCVYVALVLVKIHTRRAVAVIITTALVLLALGLAYGAPLLARFQAPSSAVSNASRVTLWRNAATLWQDAPVLGHGLDSFTSVFPFYQTLKLDNQRVLHPESDWLQWLSEAGVLMVLAAVVGFVLVLPRFWRSALSRRHGFFLQAGAFAAALTLLAHGLVDVPGHRWATVGFALAALAVALPRERREPSSVVEDEAAPTHRLRPHVPRWRFALAPLLVIALWSLPLLGVSVAWSSLAKARLLARSGDPQLTPVEVEASLRWFPLDPYLHQLQGMLLLETAGAAATSTWQHHFRAALRLNPGSWRMAVEQARAAGPVAPRYAVFLWQQAIERAGANRATELLHNALRATQNVPRAAETWRAYAETHPTIALAYARVLPPEEARPLMALWWQQRGTRSGTFLPSEAEITDFYTLLPTLGTRTMFDEWTQRHPERADAERYLRARALHGFGDDEAAWSLLSLYAKEPTATTRRPSALSRQQLELRHRQAPDKLSYAQDLVLLLEGDGDVERMREVLLSTARLPSAPTWFVRKGAYELKRAGQLREAVALLLTERQPGSPSARNSASAL